jgi:hypothetical protein
MTSPETPLPGSQSNEYSLSDLRLTKPKPVRFCYKSIQTILGDIQRVAPNLMVAVDTALKAACVIPNGAIIFDYKDVTADQKRPFTLEIGYPVADATPSPAGLEQRQLESALSAMALYIGSLTHMGTGWNDFFSKLRATSHRPSNEVRERYIYWEDAGSPNNITLLEAVLRQ